MKNWVLEVESGQQQFDVNLGGRHLLLNHVAISGFEGEIEESVVVETTIGGKKVHLATFEPWGRRQQILDAAIDENFTLSHSLRNGSLYLVGGISVIPIEDYRGDYTAWHDFKAWHYNEREIEMESNDHGKMEELKERMESLTSDEIQEMKAYLDSKLSKNAADESNATTHTSETIPGGGKRPRTKR